MSNCTKKILNVTLCPDIWFTAKNVDDIELFTEIYPFSINKPLEDIEDIEDNNAILTTKPFADNLSTPIDVDIVYFTKVKTDEDTITYLDGISNSFNKPTYDNYNSIDNVSIKPLKSVFSSVNFVNDVSNSRFIKYIDTTGYYLEELYFGEDYIDTTGYYLEELYFGEDYIENNSIFISDYIRMINNCILSEISNIIEEPKINTNKYITDDTTIVNIDTIDLYSVDYLDINYFSGIYAGNFIQNLD